MASKQAVTGFGAGPDWETFQRVWKRVMPDERNSMIVVDPPPGTEKAMPEPDVQAPPQISVESLLKQLCAGVNRAGAVVMRRTGTLSVWTLLHRQREQNLRQLNTIYFLQQGKRYACPPQPMGEQWMEMDQMLRREYLWEEHWAERCMLWQEQARGKELQQLGGEFVRQAQERQQRIRQALEQTYGMRKRT